MKIILNNSSLVFASKKEEEIVELDVLISSVASEYSKFRPAHVRGTQQSSGSARGYYVNLEGLYEQGYRKVIFKASSNKHPTDSTYDVAPGIVCTSQIPTDVNIDDVVENSVAASNVKIPRYFELPITADSKCLHASYIYSNEYAVGYEVWSPVNGDAKASNYIIE